MRTDPTLAVALFAHRQSRRGALAWTALFAAAMAAVVSAYATSYPDEAARSVLAGALNANVGFRAMFGEARAVDTVGGFLAWRMGTPLTSILSIWGLLTVTRLLRGEEDAGRWDLVLQGRITARRATLGTLLAVGAHLAVMWTVLSIALVLMGRAADLPVADSLGLCAGATLGASTFTAAGALLAQLAPVRRLAAGVAATALGLAYLTRVVADTAPGLHTLRWASPLGWFSEVRPFAGVRVLPLVLLAASTLVLGAAAVFLAGLRDSGAAILSVRRRGGERGRLLVSAEGAAVRFAAPGILAWTVGLAFFSLVLSLLARGVTDAFGESGFDRLVRQMGLGQIASVRGFLALSVFLIFGVVLSLVAGSQVGAARTEERTGRLDTLLSAPVGRRRWLASRIAVAAAGLVVCAMGVASASWAGVAVSGARIGFSSLVVAAFSAVPVAVIFLSLGVLTLGAAPRLAGGAVYGLVGGSFLLEVVGSALRAPRWILDLSPFHHLAPAPAFPVNARASVVLLALAAAAFVAGFELFARRDISAG